jgi:hypothetical protein
MKKNVFLTFVIIALFVGVVAYGLYYRSHNFTEVWVECKYQGEEPNYDEKLRFRYLVVGDEVSMYGFYHDENITPIDENDKQRTIERYNKIYEPVKDAQSKNFTYELKEEDNMLKINTYINVSVMSTTFNNYMSNSFNIKSTDSYKKVAKEMNNSSFECVVNKR